MVLDFTRSHPIATMRTPASKNMDGYFTISRVETGDIYSANSCDRYNAKMVSVSKCQCKDRGTFFLNVSIQRCYNMEETNRIYSRFGILTFYANIELVHLLSKNCICILFNNLE